MTNTGQLCYKTSTRGRRARIVVIVIEQQYAFYVEIRLQYKFHMKRQKIESPKKGTRRVGASRGDQKIVPKNNIKCTELVIVNKFSNYFYTHYGTRIFFRTKCLRKKMLKLKTSN